MWLVVLLLVGACAYDADDDEDLYDRYKDVSTSSTASTYLRMQEGYTRIMRQLTTTPARTLSDDEIQQVKGVLSDIMTGRDLKQFTPDSVTELQKLLISMSTPAGFAESLARSRNNSVIEDARRASKTRITKTDDKEIIVNGIIFRMHEHLEFQVKKNMYTYPLAGYSYKNDDTDYFHERVKCAKLCLSYFNCKLAVIDNYDLECKIYSLDLNHPNAYTSEDKYWATFERMGPTTTTTESTTEMSSTSTEIPPKIIDIRKLVEIIANLTMNTIESNITELFNATLQKYGIPMCGETTTTEEPTYDFANASIVAKCFVCGMDTPGIPHNAYCADAFAGDFLPLVPVDPRARGQIARYRKYCRYLDVPGVITNETQPRSVFGRFTGGCSVRWIDLSGVYTQRACRNRRHAVMGAHYVSKRMAKLEMALQNEDNGCIISPMSSLVPLSRGVSLYARFHACVCAGSWCNAAHAPLPWHGVATVSIALCIFSEYHYPSFRWR